MLNNKILFRPIKLATFNFLIRTICFVIILLNFYKTNAQNIKNTIVVSKYSQKADSLLNNCKLNSSITYFRKLFHLSKKISGSEQSTIIISCQKYNEIQVIFHKKQKYYRR